MGGFLKILLTAILIFYAFSMIIKLVFRRKIRKLQQQEKQFSESKIENGSNNPKPPHINPNIGEYTDFEEVE